MFGRIAVIDLGTNTFHLLVADVQPNLKTRMAYNETQFVKLAESGIDTIPEKKMERALSVLHEFNEQITRQGASYILAYATETFRKASNGQELLDRIFDETGIEVEVITGEREAELIYKGVKLAIDLNETPVLIMDIGGGSTEFIIANETQIFERFSFPAGATVLKNQFQPTDTLGNEEKQKIEEFLNETFSPLFESLKKYEIKTLIGASGSFDTLVDIMRNRDYSNLNPINDYAHDVKMGPLQALCDELMRTNAEQRIAMEGQGMNLNREPYMPVACTLIEFMMKEIKPEHLIISEFALKEGAVSDILEPKEEDEQTEQEPENNVE